MSLNSLVFFIEEDGVFRNIPWTKFLRLYFEDPLEQYPEYAGKKVKSVRALVEAEGSTAIAVSSMDFFWTYLGENGRIDRDEKVRALRLAAYIKRAGLSIESTGGSVIDAKPKFCEKRYHDQFRWTPSEAEKAMLIRHKRETLAQEIL